MQPAAAPSEPCPAMWPATPPTMAPLMQPLASAAGAKANEIAATKATDMIHFICILRIWITAWSTRRGQVPFRPYISGHSFRAEWLASVPAPHVSSAALIAGAAMAEVVDGQAMSGVFSFGDGD